MLKSRRRLGTCPGPTGDLWHHSAHAEILSAQRGIRWDDGILTKWFISRDLVQDGADLSVCGGVLLDELTFAPEYRVVDDPVVVRLQKLLNLFLDVVNLLLVAHVFEIVLLICFKAVRGVGTHISDAAEKLVDLVYVINLWGILTGYLRLHQSGNTKDKLGRIESNRQELSDGANFLVAEP